MFGLLVAKKFGNGEPEMLGYEIRELDSSEYKMWDELVEDSPHATVFHFSYWLKIYRDILNQDFRIYGCFTNEELVGGCPLYIKNNVLKLASSRAVLTPYGGVIIKKNPSDGVRKQLKENSEIINSLREALEAEKYYRVIMNLSPDFKDIRPFTWSGWDSYVLYTYYINLEKYNIKGVSKNLRKNIQHALREGVSVKRLADPDIHYDLLTMVFERQNLKPPLVTREFFDKVLKLIKSKNIGDMWVAETSTGEYVSSQIRLWDNKRVYAWTSASNPSYRKLSSNSLIYSEVLNDLKGEGFKEINMMAGNTPRFTEFITGFNPELVPYYSINYGVKNSVLKYLPNRVVKK
jgi:lipid II:glycine glycyltransferase (peptidoglycan interpeptide bridge formation enzyme)